ncbi:MAG: hypothetical protein P1P89_13575 [Desulfobacterales bacterium]|nr:hypothetical protein [Desulfobacterales bacterium]
MKIHILRPKNYLRIVRQVLILLLIINGSWLIAPAYATNDLQETKLPDSLSPGLNYLIDLVGPGSRNSFEPDRIAEVLSFVQKPKNRSGLHYTDTLFEADSAYYEFDIFADLVQVLKLSHNPDIPSFLLMPSSVRLSYWTEINGRQEPLPRMWRLLPDLKQAAIVKGIEHIENTPDIFSGAYYQYDLHRTLILFKYQGRNIFVSISKQTGTSDVGRKGLVLGSDDAWNYLYSDRKGLNKAGLGWVSSYMYDSFAVTVYDEVEPGKPLVRCGIFKWIRAGWAKLNVVNNRHIYSGLDRYAKTFKEIIEHPFLPGPVELEQLFAKIEKVSDQELRSQTKTFFNALKAQYVNDDQLSKEWVVDILDNDRYVAQMTSEEMKSIMVVQALKKILRKKFIVLKKNQSP